MLFLPIYYKWFSIFTYNFIKITREIYEKIAVLSDFVQENFLKNKLDSNASQMLENQSILVFINIWLNRTFTSLISNLHVFFPIDLILITQFT